MWKDFVYSLRSLLRSPLFTVAAVASLALGIGANTAIFSLLDQVVLRSLPVRDPESLVVLHTDYNAPGSSTSDNDESVFSYPLYRDLRASDAAFSGILARGSAGVRLAWKGNTEAAGAELVSGNYFQALGVGAAIGRTLAPSDEGAPGSNPVVVLSHAFWSAHLGADPSILNQTVALNGQPFVVVGVAEAKFHGLMQGNSPDLFVTLTMERSLIANFDVLSDRTTRWLNLFARLKPGESLPRAQAATDVAYHAIIANELAQMRDMHDERERQRFLNHRAALRPAAQGIAELRDKWEKPLRVLIAMVGLVLLIACANVAGLMVARSTGRQREIAIRLALGARRATLVRQLLIEGLVLALAGCVAGLVVEHWSTAALLSILPRQEAAGWLTASLDLPLLLYAFAISLACGLLFALLPALQATRPDLAPTLKDQALNVASGGRPARLRQVLVSAQLALSLLLVVGAGLFSSSAANLLNARLGFRTSQLLMFTINATLDRPEAAAAAAFYHDLEFRLGSMPRVVGVAAADGGPFSGSTSAGNITVEGYRAGKEEYTGAVRIAVSPGYFRALAIPLRAGREFTDRDDAAAPKAVVVNETFVKRYFGNANPIGRRLQFGASTPPKLDREIVGVVADSRDDVRDPGKETIYSPYPQWDHPARMVFYVRTAGDPGRMAAAVRQATREADPNLPAVKIKTVELRIRESLYTERLIAILSAAFGILATLLAAIGLYGVIAYSVARRTGEIGVRMALGALPADVLRLVLFGAVRLAAAGIVIGLAAALAAARLIQSQLFGIAASDPVIYAGAAVLLALVALFAAGVPAWRAARIDPVSALKYE
ncbi:MAG TPA: ABC transporter permease [Bryobacteraceae bacterium]|jgi:predicted permease